MIGRGARSVLLAGGLALGVPAAVALAVAVDPPSDPPVPLPVLAPATLSMFLHDQDHAQVAVVPVGSVVHVRVTVSGALGTPTGSVGIGFYENGSCSGSADPFGGSFELAGGIVHATAFTQQPLTPGSYSFGAVYGGSLVYTSEIGCIGFTVTKASPTVTLAIHNAAHASVGSVTTGTTVHPLVDIGGGVGPATGSVTVRYYANGTCSGTPASTSSATALVDGVAHLTSFSKTPTAGTYSFKASYGGDARYLAKDSSCKVLTVNKATPSVALVLHNAAHAAVGASTFVNTTVHPRVAVSGAVGTPAGTVVASYWDDANCTGTASGASAATPLSSGVIDLTNFPQTLPAGSFSFRAAYSGDATYASAQSACTALTVNKYTPTVSPRVHNTGHVSVTSIVIGSTVHPQVTVSGTAGTPTGSVNYSFYPNGTCSSTATSTSADYVLSGGSHDGTGYAQTLSTAQDYSFRARYLGSATYAATSVCRKITVVKATAESIIAIHDASHQVDTNVVVTTQVHARVEYWYIGPGSLGTPTGTVTMRFYSGSSCGTELAASSATALSGGVIDFTTFVQAPSSAGSYSFRGAYSGDSRFAAANTACAQLTVVKAPSTVGLTIHDSGHAVVTVVDAGAAVHPRIQVGGSVGAASGQVTAQYWTNGTCSGTPAATSSPTALTHSSADLAAFVQAPPPTAASFRASYPGDSRYLASTGSCVPLAVRKADAGISIVAHDAGHQAISDTTVPAGTTVHARMSVKGSFGTPTGTVTIALYAHSTCSPSVSNPIAQATVTSGTAVEAVFVVPAGAGFHIFYGTYSGDDTYEATGPAVGGAVCDLFKVASPTPPPATTPPTVAPTPPPGATATAPGATATAVTPSPTPTPMPTVVKATPTVTLSIHEGAHAAVTTVAAGTPVHPSAVVSGPVGAPSGAMSFGYRAGDCTSLSTADFVTGLPLVGGAHDASTFARIPLDAGTYAFIASYDGDAAYLSGLACRTFTVTGNATLPPGVSAPPTIPPVGSLAPGATPGASGAGLPPWLATPTPAAAPTGPASSDGGLGSVGPGNGATAGPSSSSGPDVTPGGAETGTGGFMLILIGLLAVLLIGGLWLTTRGRRREAAGR